MKTIASYSTPADAHVAMSRLMSAGIQAGVRDEFTVTLDWMMSNAVGGVKIEVADEDAEAAREILALPPSEEGVLRCPYCGSSDTRVRVAGVFAGICMLLKLPIPIKRVTVDCRKCGKAHAVPRNGQAARKP